MVLELQLRRAIEKYLTCVWVARGATGNPRSVTRELLAGRRGDPQKSVGEGLGNRYLKFCAKSVEFEAAPGALSFEMSE